MIATAILHPAGSHEPGPHGGEGEGPPPTEPLGPASLPAELDLWWSVGHFEEEGSFKKDVSEDSVGSNCHVKNMVAHGWGPILLIRP